MVSVGVVVEVTGGNISGPYFFWCPRMTHGRFLGAG
jgi:hypothetical protein